MKKFLIAALLVGSISASAQQTFNELTYTKWFIINALTRKSLSPNKEQALKINLSTEVTQPSCCKDTSARTHDSNSGSDFPDSHDNHAFRQDIS